MKNALLLIILFGFAVPASSQNHSDNIVSVMPCADLTIIRVDNSTYYQFVSNKPYSLEELPSLKEYLLYHYPGLEEICFYEESLYVVNKVSREMKRAELLKILCLFNYSNFKSNI